MSTHLEPDVVECSWCNGSGRSDAEWDGRCPHCSYGDRASMVDCCDVCGFSIEHCHICYFPTCFCSGCDCEDGP